jgi:3',5'-cyclic-AMP phosphodiesterase
VLPGNHDSRERLAEAFGGVSGHWAAQVGEVRLIGLDTLLPGATAGDGALGADGLAWLEAALAEAPETPTIVALHHPPVPIAFPAFDEIRLAPADGSAFAGIVARSPQVVRVVCGHVHRAVFSTVGGVPFIACPSVHLQARLELGGGPLALIPEPPAMVFHVWRDGTLTSHLQPIV